jgi:phospholipid/cholesterol/gamma-HCH transport system substrate-binding protein
MSRISPFKIGLFVLVSITVFVGGLLWVGIADFLQPTKTYLAFFDQSVEGLSAGANVDFRGIQVGRVSSVGLAPDGHLVRVAMALQPDFKVTDAMEVEIMFGGITGQPYLAIREASGAPRQPVPKLGFPVHHPVMPSRPGQVRTVENALEQAYHRFEGIDLQGLARAWEGVARRADSLLSAKAARETLDNLQASSADLRRVLDLLTESGRTEQWEKTFEDVSAAAAAARKASQALASQLQTVPPDAAGRFAERMDHLAATGEHAFDAWGKQIEQSLRLLQQSVQQVNQVLSELSSLVQSLRAEPGRILVHPRSGEPFQR